MASKTVSNKEVTFSLKKGKHIIKSLLTGEEIPVEITDFSNKSITFTGYKVIVNTTTDSLEGKEVSASYESDNETPTSSKVFTNKTCTFFFPSTVANKEITFTSGDATKKLTIDAATYEYTITLDPPATAKVNVNYNLDNFNGETATATSS